MSSLPAGVSRQHFDGRESLATRGSPIGDEATNDGWRQWSAQHSKLANMLELGMNTTLTSNSTVLYLGAAAGTTVSHLADIMAVVYAVEFAPAPMRELLKVVDARGNVIPLLKDVRQPATYGHVVEADIDVIVQDVATRNQARAALANRQFLRSDGHLLCAFKARSTDVSRDPSAVFADELDELRKGYEILETQRLDPMHIDHLAVVATPRE